jgi:hypothetical protein
MVVWHSTIPVPSLVDSFRTFMKAKEDKYLETLSRRKWILVDSRKRNLIFFSLSLVWQ